MILLYTFLAALAGYYICSVQAESRGRGRDFVEDPAYQKRVLLVPYVILCIWMVLLVGLRSDAIGIDTWNYVNHYNQCVNYPDWAAFERFLESRNYRECLYWISLYGMAKLGIPAWGTRLVYAVIAVVPVLVFIYRRSASLLLSIFFYLSLSYYAFAFTGIRQSVAMGLLVLAYMQAEKNHWLPYLLLCTAATFFHITAAIFFPVILLRWIQMNEITAAGCVLGGGTLYLFRVPIVVWLEELAEKDYSAYLGQGNWYMLFLIGTAVLLWAFQWNWVKTRGDVLLFWVACMAAVSYAVVKVSPVYMRATLYYQLMMVVSLPNMLCAIPDGLTRRFGKLCYVAAGIYFFFSMVAFDYKITPYEWVLW